MRRKPAKASGGKLARARIRHFLLTVAPDRLLGGALRRRHLSQEVQLRELTVQVPGWPEAFEGLRIGHVSDFHLGELMPLEKAEAAVARVAAARPDLLACTGDVVDLRWHGCEPLMRALAGVPARLGHFLVLGNHDHLESAAAVSRAAAAAGIRVLRDHRVSVEHGGARLLVGGVDWDRTRRGLAQRVRKVAGRTPGREPGALPHLLLAHNPKAFPAAAAAGIPLTLSGHTHGGQVDLPNHAHELRHAVRRLRRGLYAEGQSRLFVTVGAGSWFPARVNCPAEVVVLTVTGGRSRESRPS